MDIFHKDICPRLRPGALLVLPIFEEVAQGALACSLLRLLKEKHMVSKAFYIRVSTANVSSFGWLFTPRQCRDIKKYRWTPAGASGLARGVRSVMPLPSDLPLPTWLARSLKVPEETAFTTVVRLTGLGSDPEAMAEAETQQLVLLMQSCSHDAPYGEYFRIQVGHSFAAVRLGRCLYSSYGPVSSIRIRRRP